MCYKPKPIDTSHIILSPELEEAIEPISKNIHEVWAEGRLSEGWNNGTKQDKTKRHPSIVPYEELPESEKDVDRNTVTQTIKCLIHMGFQITKE